MQRVERIRRAVARCARKGRVGWLRAPESTVHFRQTSSAAAVEPPRDRVGAEGPAPAGESGGNGYGVSPIGAPTEHPRSGKIEAQKETS